ncbi:MAG: peptidylprolyl isomerase, partial [Thermoplasmatota archaeon]
MRSKTWHGYGAVCMTLMLLGVGGMPWGAAEEGGGGLNDGTTLYVGGEGPGNYSSIREALDAAAAGDTVFVYGGTYYENIVIETSVHLLGEDKQITVIDGGLNGDTVTIVADGVTLSGFTIRNGGGEEEDSGIKIHSHGNRITENIIRENGNQRYCYAQGGIYLHQASRNEISCNDIRENRETGIYLYRSDDNFIYNNSIHHNSVMALVSNASSRNVFAGNDIYENYCGMSLWPHSTHNAIVGNHIHDHPGCGLALKMHSNHNIIRYNRLSSNLEWGVMLGFGPILYNRVEFNTIEGSTGGEMSWFNGSGIVLSIAFFNTVQNNNLAGNNNDVYLENSLFNVWSQNYWESHAGRGIKVIRGHFCQPYTYHPTLTIPWLTADWRPSPNPHHLSSTRVAVMDTSLGRMVLELDGDRMPVTTSNFLRLAAHGFFDGLVFHRVIEDFVIQGGGYYPDGSRKNSPYGPIELETHPDVQHVDGAISMARTSDPHSATSQFFICDG